MSISRDSSFNQADRRKVRFEAFEVDFGERELRHRGTRIHLQKQPFQILELLLRKPGSLVTRAELAQHLWPGLHVSFARGLNTAINVLRQALGDSSASCRYIETRPGLGYRFLASVEEVTEWESAAGKRRYLPKAEAQQNYRRGRYLQSKLTEADLGKSIAHFEAAMAEDANYAPAYAGLGDTYILFALRGMLSREKARRRAEELTQSALRIDEELAEAHVTLADIRNIFDWDFPGAEREYERAIRLGGPEYSDGRRGYARFLSARERPDEALAEIRAAQELDPLSLAVQAEAARILYMGRRFEECIQQAWQTLTLETTFAPAQQMLGLAYEQVGMLDEALTELENAELSAGDDPAVLASLGHLYGRTRKSDKAHSVLGALDALAEQHYVSAYWRSIVFAGLGEPGRALDALEKAVEDRDVWLVWLKVEPRLDALRADARFRRLLEAF